MTRQLHLNAFLMGVGHHEAAWRHPRTDVRNLTDVKHFQRLARLAERGKLDSVFFADGLAVGPRVKHNTQAVFEPITLLTAMATVTERVGLIATATTGYIEPYTLARNFASLDHISGGRAGWNIVTSAGEDEAANFGVQGIPDHAGRYRRAAEFVDVATALWDSWEDDAIVGDKVAPRFVDPANKSNNHRSILSERRSLGSVIKLLTPSDMYTDEYNAFLESIPAHIKELIFTVKRFYQPSWGQDWRSHFSVGIINGRKGNSLRLDGEVIKVNMLRVGFEDDGAWRLLSLRPDFSPAAKVQTEDDITASIVAPGGLVSNLDFVEGIFGNGGDPYLPENDSSLAPESWTGHTGCVILAPHLTTLTKKELGLPRFEDATERQRRDGMCWRDASELYTLLFPHAFDAAWLGRLDEETERRLAAATARASSVLPTPAGPSTSSGLPSRSARNTCAAIASMRARTSPLRRKRSERITPCAFGSEISKFSRTVRSSYTDGVWNLRPTPARTMSNSAMRTRARPSNMTRPADGRVLPQMMSSSVVLPAPFGPMMTRSSSCATLRLRPSTALKPSNDTVRSSTLRMAPSPSQKVSPAITVRLATSEARTPFGE